MLRDVWLAFTHGLAIPSLFPVALLSIWNNYMVEKLCFAYFYQQPPLYDNKFNRRVINILKIAPLSMLLSGYWLLGNRQMFFNEVNYVVNANDVSTPNHHILDFSKGVNGSLFLLIFIPIFGVTYLTSNWLLVWITKYRFK